MSNLAALNKSFSISCKGTKFGHFWQPSSTFKFKFLNIQAKFQKVPGQFPGEFVRKILLKFQLAIFSGLRGEGSRYANRHFRKTADFSYL